MAETQERAPTSQSGFTLLELLVVIAILGLLAALVGPKLFNILGGAKSKLAVQQIDNIGGALDLYKLDVGSYPTSEQGLTALVTKPRMSSPGTARTPKVTACRRTPGTTPGSITTPHPARGTTMICARPGPMVRRASRDRARRSVIPRKHSGEVCHSPSLDGPRLAVSIDGKELSER